MKLQLNEVKTTSEMPVRRNSWIDEIFSIKTQSDIDYSIKYNVTGYTISEPTNNTQPSSHQNNPVDTFYWGSRFKQFIHGEWSVHGVKYVARQGSSYVRTIVWLCLLIFGFSFMVFQIRDRIRYYTSNPTQVDISLNYENHLTFPTVTVCNEYMLDRDRSMYRHILPAELTVLIEQIYPPWPDKTFKPNFTVVHTLNAVLVKHNISWHEFWYSLSPFHKKRHLEKCVFNGEVCGPEDFTLVTTSMGFCLQFNGDGFNYTTDTPGSSSGLLLVVDARQRDYLLTKSRGAGFRVLLSSKKDIPHVYEMGFRASTGSITSAAVQLQTVTRLPAPYGRGNCSDVPNYITNECLYTCRHKQVIETCGCKYFYFQGSKATVCNPQEMYECADIVMAQYPMNYKTADNCTCPPQCHTLQYKYRISQAVLSNFAIDKMATIQQKIKCENISNCTFDMEAAKTLQRDDLAEIEIFYSELLHKEIKINKAYPLLQLLCDVGGAMGLILGSTLLSFFELCDFFIYATYDWLKFNFGRRKRKKKSPIV